MNPWWSLCLALGGTFIASVAAMASKVLDEMSWHELQDYCRLHRMEPRFDEIHEHADDVLGTTESLQLLGTLVALIAIAGWLFQFSTDASGPFSSGQAWIVMIVVALTFLTLTIWIPQEVADRWGPPYLVSTWRIWRAADVLLRPLHLFSVPVRFVLRRLDGPQPEPTEEEALEDEILSIVAEGQHDGLLEADVREMIEGVIELDDTDVADIMTPRSEMDSIPVDMDWNEMVQFVVRVGRTRIPVYGRNLDDIVGVLYAKDLLAALSREGAESRDLREILREARQVPRSTRLDELLQMFLQNRNHLAIVVDEFMHVVGLVTIEDVLEEIVGEIVDEHDKEELGEIRHVTDQVAEVHARAHLHDINEALGTQFPEEEDYDTLGGFVLSQLCRIPEPGEALDWQDVRLVILEANRRRVERVRVELEQEPKTLSAR